MINFSTVQKAENMRKLIDTILRFHLIAMLVIPEIWAAEASLAINGWPEDVLATDTPNLDLGYDPVLGRLLCPPGLRLHSGTGKFEGILLDLPRVSAREDGTLPVWEYVIRTGLYWWDNSHFTSEDLRQFLEEHLAKIIQEKSGKKLSNKSYSLKVLGERKVRVVWQEDPNLGPYIISGYPIFKKNDRQNTLTKFMCVGTYFPSQTPQNTLRLKPVPGYRQGNPILDFNGDISRPHLQVYFADDLKMATEKNCKTLTLPYLTMIIPSKTGKLAYLEMRKYLDSALPSDTQLRAITHGLFRIPRSPLLLTAKKDHNSEVSPVNSKKEGLLAFARQQRFSSDKDGFVEIALTVREKYASPAFHKILSDNMASLGFLLKVKEGGNEKGSDGLIATYRAPFPEMNILPLLLSLDSFPLVLKDESSKRVSRLAFDYLKKLSYGQQHRNLLEAISEIFVNELVFLPIMQYRACILDNTREKSGKINYEDDPDWIRAFLKTKT